MTNVPGDTGDVAAALAKLADRRAELNRLDDQYLALIARTEESLRALGVGLRISTAISRTTSREYYDSVEYLTFDKAAGAWRLAIESGPDDGDPESWTSTPLASCDRDTRFSVFADGHLARLVLQSLAELEQAINRRQAHLASSQALVETIEQARPARSRKGGKP